MGTKELSMTGNTPQLFSESCLKVLLSKLRLEYLTIKLQLLTNLSIFGINLSEKFDF